MLAAAAYAIDDETGERISFALRDAFFEQGLDIADPTVRDGIASAERSLSPTAFELSVLDDFEEGKRRAFAVRMRSSSMAVVGIGQLCTSTTAWGTPHRGGRRERRSISRCMLRMKRG